MRKRFTALVCVVVFQFLLQMNGHAQQKRIYVSNDDHTDYMWTDSEAGYDTLIPNMLDRWIFYNDSTKAHIADPNYWSKWNCDGSFWVADYKKQRSAAQFDALIAQIRNGQITVPYSPLVATYGGVPAEAILRGMYYAGKLERDYGLDFDMATAMENQTLPLGLASLWKGSGAKYCWHGVCNCSTELTGIENRANEMYWYKGLDTNKILLKWYKMADPTENYFIGGYAEARLADNAIDALSTKCNTTDYPYNIAAGFGTGHDNNQTLTDDLVTAAMDINNSNASQQVIVSNETDFFKDFETTYGNTLPQITQTFGNEWDLNCASIAELSAKMKRSMEKLRSAEAMAAIVTNYYPVFAGSLDSLRKEAWNAIGLYWEHSLGFDGGGIPLSDRYFFQTRLQATFSSYVDQLYNLAKSNLGNLITNQVPTSIRFFAFNPLGWVRTDFADYLYNGILPSPFHVVDVNTAAEVPAQTVTKDGLTYLRIEAANIPSVGYKVFEILPGAGASAFPNTGTVDLINNVIESDSFRIDFTNAGVLTSVIDKHNGNRQIVEAGKYLNDLGSGNSNAGSTILENNGPVSMSILSSSNSPVAHTTRITLYKKTGRIEIDNQISQNFSDTKTWAYSFNIASPEIWHEETGAVIKAKLTSHGGHYATQNARYDWSTLNHFASVNESGYGVSLSNQDCYFMKIGNSSINTLDENSAQLNVLAGGRISNLGIDNQGGESIFNQRFAITTHTAYSAAAEMKKALEHQDSIVCGEVYNPVNFLLPSQYSYVSNDEPQSLIWAIKPSEEGIDGGTITRIWNLSNNDVAPTLSFNLSINNAKRTTHVETDMNSITPDGKNLHTATGQNEMRTYRTRLVVLPLASKAVILNGEKISGSNILTWETTGSYTIFELERSTNGQQFTSIMAADATGGNYHYTDNTINIATPYYYRLRMLDANHAYSYSNTVLIKAAKEASNIILYPNPVKDIIRANFILTKRSRGTISIFNASGQIVKTIASPLFERGNNYFMIPVNGLPAGAYIFTVEAEDKKFVKGFIKE